MKTDTHSSTAVCSTCQYWSSDAKASKGECRRHAPQMLVFQVDANVKFESRFPITLGADWCGDHKLK